MSRRVVALAVALAIASAMRAAAACTCGLGPARFVTPDHALLPANARALPWWSGGVRWDVCPTGKTCEPTREITLPPTAKEFRIERLEGRAAVTVPHHLELLVDDDPSSPWGMSSTALLVVATEGLEAGKRYRFRAGEYALWSTTVTVAEDRLYSDSGRIAVDDLAIEKLEVAAKFSCTAPIRAAWRSLHFELPDRAAPFASALMFTTKVDGMPWQPAHSMCTPPAAGRSWAGVGKDLLFSVCDEQGTPRELLLVNPLTEAYPHRVTMQAVLPATDVVFTAPAVDVSMLCPEPAPAAVPASSANERPIPEADASSLTHCDGCAVGGEHATAPWTLAAVAAVLVALRRRLGALGPPAS